MTKMPFAVVAALAVAVPVAAADDVKTEAATAEAFFQVLKDRPDEAERVMAALVQDHPTAEAWAARTRVQLRVGNVDGATVSAAEALKAAVAAPPQARAAVAEAHALLGSAHQDAGNAERALADYATAVEFAPDNLDYRRIHGLLLGMNGRPEEGITELSRVAEDPRYTGADAWMNLGRLYRMLVPPRADESVAAYEKALRTDPTNAGAALGIGWAQLVARRYGLARTAFMKAMELDARTAGEAWYGVGWSHYFTKDPVRATEAATNAKTAGQDVERLMTAIASAAGRGRPGFRLLPPLILEPDPVPDVGSLCAQLLRGSRAAQKDAANVLGRRSTKGAIDCLVFSATNAQDLLVRQAAVASLGEIGAPARTACPHLKAMVAISALGPGVITAEEQKIWIQWADLRRAAKTAMGKIGC